MIRYFVIAVQAALIATIVPSASVAQSEEEGIYLRAAEPYMTLSCQGLVDIYGDDEERMEEIISLMTAVSVINRQIDIQELLPDAEAEKEFGEFLEAALTAQCEEDVDSLIAGNVDRAVFYAFTSNEEGGSDDEGEQPKE